MSSVQVKLLNGGSVAGSDAFLRQVRRALLLALRETGTITEAQLFGAAERLHLRLEWDEKEAEV